MAANIFGRYVWLIEQFRRYGRLTYEEVNDLWHRSGLSYGDDDDLALRTFHNHRKAIFDIFEVEIACTLFSARFQVFFINSDIICRNLRPIFALLFQPLVFLAFALLEHAAAVILPIKRIHR